MDAMDSAQSQEGEPADPLTKSHGDAKVSNVSHKHGRPLRSRLAWEDLRSTITSLLWDEGKGLSEVMRIMNVDHGFEASYAHNLCLPHCFGGFRG